MKKPSEMTVHELVKTLLDIHDSFEDGESRLTPEEVQRVCMEAAERLELAADGQGVGPTAIKSGS